MVVDRQFPGVAIEGRTADPEGVVLHTQHYSVLLREDSFSFAVRSPTGRPLHDSLIHQENPTLLNWPGPLEAESYAVVDFPRFFVPAWGPTPVPEGVFLSSDLHATNGYDFRNNVENDTYVFLLGNDVDSWQAARMDFLQLAGPCPLLPDFSYGTWFTWWHPYTEAEAMSDVERWAQEQLPIDVWGLDMNWRHTKLQFTSPVLPSNKTPDYFYDQPDVRRFPDYANWFRFLRERGLHTYFNDHAYPVAARGAGGLQTSPEEVAFRWHGLTRWLARGLTFWWFDKNWCFTIPPPFSTSRDRHASWKGLGAAAWGSHIYFSITSVFERSVQNASGMARGNRPIALTSLADVILWNSSMGPARQASSPSQHRYPVWWTGDNVPIRASTNGILDAGVHGFKPFVHSDCGGFSGDGSANLLRWTAHCVFSPIVRFHGWKDHRPWMYDDRTKELIAAYLRLRYKLAPSLIAGGVRATRTGFPLAARCDLYWPRQVPKALLRTQYIFLEDILVAPSFADEGVSLRKVWVPPGLWEDAWDGSIVKGPVQLELRPRDEQQPMWFRRNGGLLVLSAGNATRIATEDWSSLIIEAFPSRSALVTNRTIFERGTDAGTPSTNITLQTTNSGNMSVVISAASDGTPRAWVIRFHLLPDQNPANLTVATDGQHMSTAKLQVLRAAASVASEYFPLGGQGSLPASKAGAVLEVTLPQASGPRIVTVPGLLQADRQLQVTITRGIDKTAYPISLISLVCIIACATICFLCVGYHWINRSALQTDGGSCSSDTDSD